MSVSRNLILFDSKLRKLFQKFWIQVYGRQHFLLSSRLSALSFAKITFCYKYLPKSFPGIFLLDFLETHRGTYPIVIFIASRG